MSIQHRSSAGTPEEVLGTAANNVLHFDAASTFLSSRKIFTEVDSERSYSPLYPAEDVQTAFVFLSFNIKWRFMDTIGILTRYTIIIYGSSFDENVIKQPFVFCLYVVCSTLDIIDITSSILHYFKPKARAKKTYNKHWFSLIILDLIYLTSLPMEIHHSYVSNSDAERFIFVMTIYRLYKCILFCRDITASPLRQGILYVLTKYTTMLYIAIMSATCIMMYIGCYGCDDGGHHWTEDIEKDQSPFMLFAESFFFTFAGFTTIGIGGASKRNNNEEIIYVAMMLFSLFMMNGVFLGTFTSVQIDSHYRRSLFGKHFVLIKQQLEVKRTHRKLKKKITNWYYNFWIKESGITKTDIIGHLPISLTKDVLLDKYWYAINQSHLLRHTHIGFKREIALLMETIYFNRGDVILQQDQKTSKMYFLAKGLIQIVAPDDIESPIITLGFGTCIADLNLLMNTPIRANVTAASYCKMYVLNKVALWRAAVTYAHLRPSRKIHESAKFMIRNALNQKHRNIILKKKNYKKLKFVKKMLETKLNEYSLNANKVIHSLRQSDMTDSYIIEKTEISSSGDTIFVTNSWPWILYPKTQLTYIWEAIIILYTILVVIVYPYVIFFLTEKPTYYRYFLRPMAYLIYSADIIIQIFTAVENEQQNLTIEVSEIVAKKFTMFSFMFDLFSIMPIDIIFTSTTFGKYFECNHMIKIIRVAISLKFLSTSFKFETTFTKVFVYVIVLIYTCYVVGFIYYVAGCQEKPCITNSWVTQYAQRQKHIDISNESDKSIIFISMLYGLLAITGTGGRFFIVTWREKITLCFFFFFVIFLYTYLLADYSATLTLHQMFRDKFLGIVTATRKFITINKMEKIIMNRISCHMDTQWDINNGILVQELMKDLPYELYERFSKGKYSNLLKSVPLFKLLSGEMILKLSAKSINEFHPRNEFVVHSGSTTLEMYIIEKGYCVIKSAHGEQILGPESSICVIDMLLGVPVLHSVRTLTNVSLLRISYADLISVLNVDMALKEKIQDTVEQTKNTITVKRLFVKTNETLESLHVKEEQHGSFFIFPDEKLDPLNIDYENGWSGYNMLRHFLRRRTILPQSSFIYLYVIYYCVVIFLSCIIDPCLFIYQCFLPRYITILMSMPLDILGFLDVYIRMHVCYYNNDGILVTHPRCTALHYITNAFAIDVLTSIPLKICLDSVLEAKPLQYLIIFVKVVKAYRVPNAFALCTRDRLKTESILWSICKNMILTIIILNSLAAVQVLIGCDYRYVDDKYILEPYEISWVYSKTLAETAVERGVKSNPMKIYLLALYYITTIIAQLGIGDIMASTSYEVLYNMLVITYGFIWFTKILVSISTAKAVLNENLTKYQNYMNDLLVFQKKLHLNKATQRKSIRHFEYLWQRTQGCNPKKIFKNFNLCLKGDCLLNLYYETFNSVLMFQQLEIRFYCQLGEMVDTLYYLHDFDIVNVHNILDSVYIVHRGEIGIYGPTNQLVTCLSRGGIFGNLDEVSHSRSMITVKSNNAVDILCVKTMKFYELLGKYPAVKYSFQDYLIRNNLAYITNVQVEGYEEASVHVSHQRTTLNKLEMCLMTRFVQLFYMLMAFASYMIVLYQATFQNHDMRIVVITYTLDFLHAWKMYLLFITPYINKGGDIVTNRKLIKKRCLRQYSYYYDLFALLPLELLSPTFVLESGNIWMNISWLRLNRLLRMFTVNSYFKVTDEYLNVNVLIIKLCSTLVYFAVFLHTETCVWFLIACPNKKCNTASWNYDPTENQSACLGYYLCTLYYTCSLLTQTGYASHTPRSYADVTATLFAVLISKFIGSTFISDVAAIVRHYGHRLGAYTFSISIYKYYMQNGNISFMLQKRMMNYLDQLWYVSKGRQIPVFLEIGPDTLKEEIKVYGFGNHIFTNVLFYNCHIDFLRQLISFAKLERYFNGDVICRQGDINEMMYFIHTGSVDVFLLGDTDEVHIDSLKQLDCFGMIQGLFPNIPHAHTYKCTSVTEVVVLCLRDWIHLLPLFPAAKYTIYDSLEDCDGRYISPL